MSTLPPAATDPVVGDLFGPKLLVASSDLIRAYVNSLRDEAFPRHAAGMRLLTGKSIAPPTLFDRELGTRLYASRYTSVYALHAKQAFEFLRPVEEGLTYTISGKLATVYERNQIGYAAIEATCDGPDGLPAVRSVYTRAFRFPGNQYRHKGADRVRPTVASFLEQSHAAPGARFPEVGSVLEGVSRQFTQSLMNLYSGPGSNIHTDPALSRRRGHSDALVQGLMATALECELYRDVFGSAWYTTGKLSVKYIDGIIANARLAPIAVVVADAGGRLELRTAVHGEQGELLTIGSASVERHPQA
jgi:hypothetical protein